MAINSNDNACDRIPTKSQGSSKCYSNRIMPSRLVKIDFSTESSICSMDKFGRKYNNRSPYYSGDNIQLLSNLTEKRFVRKKAGNTATSFPMSGKLYKANSDEFKALKNSKKVQKSVLTLPNEAAPAPQCCTVSDMNDSEYFNRDDDNRKKNKKRIPPGRSKKIRSRSKNLEFYDRDAVYCSQIGIDLDCSSSDTIKKYNCNENNSSKLVSKNCVKETQPHEVWAILRDMNSFGFRPSPPMSDESLMSPKKKAQKRRNNRKDVRMFERCTEEFAYISSYEVDSTSCNCLSQSSSFDKITVIEKKNGFNKLCRGFEQRITRKKKGVKLPAPYTKTNNKNVVKNKNIHAKLTTTKETTAYRKKDNLCSESSFMSFSNNKEEKRLSNCNRKLQGLTIPPTDTNDNKKIDQCQELISSESSSGCKAVSYETTNPIYEAQKDSSSDIHSDEVELQINGITKVVVQSDHTVVQPNKINTSKKKNYQTSPIKNKPVTKFTKAEIQRQLNKQKYPIVILRKDQLSSMTIKVINEESVQFDGLDKQIWPFMRSWSRHNHANNTYESKSNLFYTNEQSMDRNREDAEKSSLPVQLQNNRLQSPKSQDAKTVTELNFNNTTIGYNRSQAPPVQKINQMRANVQAKTKPMQQFRERMLKLLYKNTASDIEGSNNSDNNKNVNCNNNDNNNNDNICNGTKESIKPNCVIRRPISPTNITSTAINKRPWAKAKWASEFIENVIKKIKAGVYYTHETKVLDVTNKENLDKDFKEIDDTDKIESIIKNADKSSTTVSVGHEYLTIPGFDNVLPAVEIKSMNLNEISVKHCITNVMVRFDVSVPMESTISSKNSFSLIPLEVNDNHTKVFKCKTSIIHSMLPAELCSILPNMLQSITKAGEHLALLPVSVKSSTPHLSTITEVAQYENNVDLQPPSIVADKPKSRGLCRLLNGGYLNARTSNIYTQKKTPGVKYEKMLVRELVCMTYRVRVRVSYILDNCEVNTMMPPTVISQNSLTDEPSEISSIGVSTPCTAIQPYEVSESRLLSSYKMFNITTLFENIANFIKNRACQLHTVKMRIQQSININNVITLTMNIQNDFLLYTNSLTTGCSSSIFKDSTDNTCTALIEFMNIPNSNNKENNTIRRSLEKCASVNMNNNTRRKRFVKLYRKCKFTTNVSKEKVTPLKKITNLDDFFLALGSGKSLSSVFDSQSGHKIMSSLNEMKNWTLEINPKQALLVLLLTNKKVTSNLLRYKPVLLQGIAMKRITKASELDMEIEVIERENLKSCRQYEGFTYLPASIENQDALFEELCWIAKTTASDYQKPFDETSEKLLKSLLEKRKKINPSYLRVMARYVGLGLLKSPGKKCY